MVSQERDVDVCDLLVRQEDESIVTGDQPRPVLRGLDLEDVDSLAAERYDVDAHTQAAVPATELVRPLFELPAEEPLVEHGSDPNSAESWATPQTGDFGPALRRRMVFAIDREDRMAIARVVSFEGVDAERIEELRREISEGEQPEGLDATEFLVLHDADGRKSLAIVFFETEEDYRRGDAILDAMPAGDTPGQRTSVSRYDVAVRMTP